MPRIQAIAPQHTAIEAPTELRLLQGWLLYRLEQPEGADKPLKVPTTIRFDADVLAALKASGKGWQTRVNEAMR